MRQGVSNTHFKIIITVALVCLVIGIIQWIAKKRKSNATTSELGLKEISRRKFINTIGKHKFSCMNSWIATPGTSFYYSGIINDYNTLIFSIAVGRSSSVLAVLIKSISSTLPNFIIKPKTFSEQVSDMLDIRKHHPSYPSWLTDNYDVTSDDEDLFASMLSTDLLGFLLKNERLWIELHSGDMLVREPISDAPENYKTAIENAHALAHLLEMKPPNNFEFATDEAVTEKFEGQQGGGTQTAR